MVYFFMMGNYIIIIQELLNKEYTFEELRKVYLPLVAYKNKYEIKEEKFAVFKFLSRQQKEIVRFEGKINSQWIPSTNYNAKTDLKVELYKEGYCYIYLPIE